MLAFDGLRSGCFVPGSLHAFGPWVSFYSCPIPHLCQSGAYFFLGLPLYVGPWGVMSSVITGKGQHAKILRCKPAFLHILSYKLHESHESRPLFPVRALFLSPVPGPSARHLISPFLAFLGRLLRSTSRTGAFYDGCRLLGWGGAWW